MKKLKFIPFLMLGCFVMSSCAMDLQNSVDTSTNSVITESSQQTADNTTETASINKTTASSGSNETKEVTSTADSSRNVYIETMDFQLPSDITIYEGEDLNITGITATATYSDGKTKTFNQEELTVATGEVNTAVAGSYSVKVSYSIFNDSFQVVVKKDSIKTLTPNIIEDQKVLLNGTYTPVNLTITALYESGKIEDVTDKTSFTCNTSSKGTVKATAVYNGLTVTFDVIVYEATDTLTLRLTPSATTAGKNNGDVSSYFSCVDSEEVSIADYSSYLSITTNKNSSNNATYISSGYARLYYASSGEGGELVLAVTDDYVIDSIVLVVTANNNDVSYTVNGTGYALTKSESTNNSYTISSDTVTIKNVSVINARLEIHEIEINLSSAGSTPVHKHNYIITDSKEATCTETGYNVYTCNDCESSYTVTIAALGHEYNSDGICTRCNTAYVTVPENYFISDEVTVYTVSSTNPYNVDLTKYGEDTKAIFYSPNISSASYDKYSAVVTSDFYSDYKIATTYEDAYFRTKHHLLSGTIENQSHLTGNGLITSSGTNVRCSTGYYILDYSGKYLGYIINGTTPYVIFYGAAYIGMNEVAAYLLAFGEVPANSNYDKGSTGKSNAISDYGKYGRVNMDDFSGSTTNYPYEPVLTDINGCGGSTYYTETDFGSQGGFDCNGTVKVYNDGSSISRGTCRFVFVNMKNNIYDINKRHVFYTYNHYNDFQEYMNYWDGFSERFGNESSGNAYNTASPNTPTSVPGYTLKTAEVLFA